jgi:hypothetical protein
MKIEKEIVGKKVYVRLRTGGSYSGKVGRVESTFMEINAGNGTVRLQNGMIASLQVLEMSKVD